MSREELGLAELTGLPRIVLARLRGPLQWVLALIVLSLLPALALAQSTGVNGGGPNGGSSGVSQIVAGTNVTISPPGGTGTVTVNATGGGGGTPATPTKSVQFNNSGAFGGTSNFLWDNTNDVLSIGGTSGGILDSLTGQNLSLLGGNALTDATEAAVTIGTNGATGIGGPLTLNAGNAVTSGAGGPAALNGGNATGTNQGGGPVTISAGTSTGTATQGTISFVTHGSNRFSIFETGDWGLAGAPGTLGQVISSNGPGVAPTWKSLSSILGCTANQIVFDSASGQLTCDATLSYTLANEVLQLGTTTSNAIPAFLVAEGTSLNADTHILGMWADNFANHFAMVPDSGVVSNVGDFLTSWRDEGSVSGACQQGAVVAPYITCRVALGTNKGSALGEGALGGTQLIIGPLNTPPGSFPNDIGFRFRGFDNDSLGILGGCHGLGTECYGWSYLPYSGATSSIRMGPMMETVPVGATSASLAQRIPHETGALAGTVSGSIVARVLTVTAGTPVVGQTLVFSGSSPSAYLVVSSLGGGQYSLSNSCFASCSTITGNAYNELAAGYEGWMISPGEFVVQLSDGGLSSDLGGPLAGTTVMHLSKVAGSAQTTSIFGENTNSSSVTNIVGGSTANTQANGSPLLTLASGGNITVAPTISSQGVCLANGTNCPISAPAGSSGQMQYNNGGVLAGDGGLKTDGAGNLTLGTTGAASASISGATVSGVGNGSTFTVSGQNGGTTSGNSGTVTVRSATPVEGASGSVTFTSANAAGTSAHNSGNATLSTGTPTVTGTSGTMNVITGSAAGGGLTGSWTGGSGNETNATSGNTGPVKLASGNSTAGNSGAVTIGSGSAPGTAGSLNFQVNGTMVVQYNKDSHYNYGTTSGAPAVSACGTSPSIDAHATDASGTVTVGTVAAASCTVTFHTAFTTWNHCRITSQSTIASFAYSYTLSAITVTGTSLVGDLFDYDCDGT